MKKFVLSFLILSLSIFSGQAQADFTPEWNVGFSFGTTYSDVSFVPFVGANPRTKNFSQFQGGVAIRYITEKNIGIIGELNYSQQGWKSKFEDLPSTFKQQHSLTYLELPILTHFYVGNKVRFFANLGPKIQYLLSEKEEMSKELADYIVNNTNQNYVTLHFNRNVEHKFDYGLLLGGGLEFRTGIGNFALEGRYYFGLGDIYRNKKNDENLSRSANRVISAKLTYFVKLF